MGMTMGPAVDPAHAVLTVSGAEFDPRTILAAGSLKPDYVWLQGETKPWGRPNKLSGLAVTAYSGDVFELTSSIEHFISAHEEVLKGIRLQRANLWLTVNIRLDLHAGAASIFRLSRQLIACLSRFDIELSFNASSQRLVQRSYGLACDEDEPGPFERLETYVKEETGTDSVSGYLSNMRAHASLGDDLLINTWGGLLESLGWRIRRWSAPVQSIGLGLKAWSERLQCEIPLVFAPFAYLPGDDSDRLVEETKDALSEQYPDGVLLGFETLMFKEVDGSCYTFGGLLFFRDQWRPFALSSAATSFDALLAQRESGFSFQKIQRGHEDEGGVLATGFNLMLQGGDPEQPWKVVYLHQGEWQIPMLVC